MTENMKKLLELVSGNKELAAKIGGMGKEDIIALARELGVEFTEADFAQKYELSDDDLAQVSAAGETTIPTMNPEVLLGRHARPDNPEDNRP